MAFSINLTHGAMYFDDIDDLHELSRMANAAGEYARESGRMDLVERFTAFGRMVRHAASESYRTPIGAARVLYGEYAAVNFPNIGERSARTGELRTS